MKNKRRLKRWVFEARGGVELLNPEVYEEIKQHKLENGKKISSDTAYLLKLYFLRFFRAFLQAKLSKEDLGVALTKFVNTGKISELNQDERGVIYERQKSLFKNPHVSVTRDKWLWKIAEWLEGRKENQNPDEDKNLDISKLTARTAYVYADAWSRYVKGQPQLSSEDWAKGEVVISYDDGFYWEDLGVGDSTNVKEMVAMKNCGTNMQRGSHVYSLRNKSMNTPVANLDFNPEKKIVYAVAGPGNDKPDSKYHKYIVDFLTNSKTNVKDIKLYCDLYNTNTPNNYYRKYYFQLEDLSPSLFNKLKDLKPEFIDTDKTFLPKEIRENYVRRIREEINLPPNRDNTGKLLHTGNTESDYIEGAKKSVLKVGDRVKVLKKFEDYAHGIRCSWNPGMDDTVGKVGKILRIHEWMVYQVDTGDGAVWWYPYFVLKKV